MFFSTDHHFCKRSFVPSKSTVDSISIASRMLIACCFFVATAAAASAQETPAEDPGQSNSASSEAVQSESQLVQRQAGVAQRYQKLEELLLRLADMESVENPERAALLRRAARQSRDQFVLDKLRGAAESLKTQEFQKAVDNQQAATEELAALLKLLLSEDRSKRIRDEKERYTRLIKDLKRNLNNQRSTRARTENSADLDDVQREQKSVTDRSEELRGQLQDSDAAESDGDRPENESSESESSENESSESESEQSGKQRSKDQDSESDDAGKQSPEDRPSEDESKQEESEQEGSESKPQDGKSPQSDESTPAKPAQSDQQGDSQQPQQGQQQSQQQQGQQQQQQSQQQSSQQSPQSQQQPSTPEQQAQKQLERAIEKMKEAEKELEDAKREDATERQREAEENLRAAIDQLERILRQLREEEMLRELAKLEARLRKMASMQTAVLDDTIALAATPESQRDRQTDLKAGNLAFEEKKITLEANRALLLLREEGSSVAFPEVVSQIRGDTVRVAEMLGQTRIDAVSQGIQQDILAALEEMIAALQKAQRDLEQQQQQQQQGQPQQGGQGEQPLVESLAELKLIRTMETRIKKTTDRYADLLQQGDSSPAEVLPLLQDLSERQNRLVRITRDLVLKRNQ